MSPGRTVFLTVTLLLISYQLSSGLAISSENTLLWSKHSEISRAANGGDSSCKVVESSRHCQKWNQSFDLQSPRKWLEYCEIEDGRNGAYTVLRCDFHPSTDRWNIWGRHFHMDRLVGSFWSLQDLIIEEEISTALNATNLIIESLLEESRNSIFGVHDLPDALSESVVTLMLTVLWVPTGRGIKVRGHAFHSGQLSVPSQYNPEPMIASIAQVQNERLKEFPSLPNRYMNSPQSKLSSWCRQRSPLEEEFKTEGIGEVLLTRELENNDVELLEGLTSNLFVVYQDGSLRTPAADSVLGGYSRQLVLEHAKDCGLQIQVEPLRLSERLQWKEVFTTSAIRLISPVAKIVTVQKLSGNDKSSLQQHVVETLWTRESTEKSPLWKRIYQKILAGQQK
jgi:hypothetical protein